ncbi:MAG TPA: hypothetical protein VKT32_13970, partial [Chthonomonadaceae bacterium]|nr:hypothetical protein [Chthonomonadaceae bacterium]
RTGDNGEEEGGPAYAVVQIGPVPLLTVDTPGADAAYTLPDPVPVHGALQLAGAALARRAPELRLHASLLAPGGDQEQDLTLDATGAFATRIPSGSRPGPATLRITLRGRYGGGEIAPQTALLPLTLALRPVVQVRWEAKNQLTGDPDDLWELTAQVRSSANSVQQVALACQGAPGLQIEPATLTVAPNGPERTIPVRLRWHHLTPGNYPLTVAPTLAGQGVDLNAVPFTGQIHIRTWLERNRWWFYPCVALAVLLALIITGALSFWMKEQARRQRKLLAVLNGAALYIPGKAEPFRPPEQKALVRRSYTFGGKGADVLIPDPTQPGQPLFQEPRVRLAVDWDRKHRRPRLQVTPEGTATMLYDQEMRLIGDPIVPTEGGALFLIDPEHILVSVNSEWTA